MKKILLTTLVLCSTAPLVSLAHPTYESELYLYTQEDATGTTLPNTTISYDAVLDWFQATILVEKEMGVTVIDPLSLDQFSSTYLDFVSKNLTLTTTDTTCAPSPLQFISLQESGYVEQGVVVHGTLHCDQPVTELSVRNKLFLGTSESLTSLIHVMQGQRELQIYKIIPGEQTVTVALEGGQKGFAFLSALLPYTDTFFAGLTAASTLGVLLLTFILGLLHTLEAGHSKTILAAAMLDHRMSIRQGILYAIVFTITHIADIVLLGLVFLIIGTFTDIYRFATQIHTFAALGLLAIAIYLLQKNVTRLLQHRFGFTHHHHEVAHEHTHEHDHEHHHHNHSHGEEVLHDPSTFKEQLWLGFLSGLAPCAFGWSVFMLILTAKSAWVLVPAILSFGLGIFVTLVLLVFTIGSIKHRFYHKLQWLGTYSPIISAALLVVYALVVLL